MAYLYYKSKPDGTIDTEIQSGVLGTLFSSITVAERVSGNTEFQKVWISGSEDSNTYIGISDYSAYINNVFVSANETDAEGDLTGSEARYGALKVVSGTVTDVIVENDAYTLVRVGDNIAVGSAPYEVATVIDNGDGTSTATIDFVVVPTPGSFITSLFILTLTTGTPKPFWVEREVLAGSTWSGGNIVVNLKIGK